MSTEYSVEFLQNSKLYRETTFCREILLSRMKGYFDQVKITKLINYDSVQNEPEDIEYLIYDIMKLKVNAEILDDMYENDDGELENIFITRIILEKPHVFNLIYDISAILWFTLSRESAKYYRTILIPSLYDSYEDYLTRIYLYLRQRNLIFEKYNELLITDKCNGPATLAYFLLFYGIVPKKIFKEIEKEVGDKIDLSFYNLYNTGG